MRCDRVRRALTQRQLGFLDPGREADLSRHLEHCRSCRAVEAEEEILSRELAALGSLTHPGVDVTRRTLSEIRALGPVSRAGVPGRQLAWAFASAVAFAVAAGAGIVLTLPALPEAVVQIREILGAIWATVSAMLLVPEMLLRAASAVAGRLCGLLEGLVPFLGRLLPVSIYGTLAAFAAVTAVTTFLVGRDLLAPAAGIRKGESR
jgi:hypothetical protein